MYSGRRQAALIAAALCTAAYAAAQTHTATTIPGSSPPKRKLSIVSAQEEALRNSPLLKAAAERVRLAQGAVSERRSAFLPTVAGEATLTHLDQGVTTKLGPDPASSVTIVKQDQKSANLTASLPLDIAGMLKAAVSLSEFQCLIARLDYNKVRNQLIQDVTIAYLDVLRSTAFLKVANAAADNAEERHRIAAAQHKAGTGTRFDVLRSETDMANARQAVLSAGNRVALAIAAANSVLGFDQNTPLELEPVVEPQESKVPELSALIEEAYRNRPESLQATAGISAAEKGHVLASRDQMPTLGLAWNLQYTPDTGAFGRESSWSLVARARIPIFDGGVSAARRSQALADIAAARQDRVRALDGIALEVRQSYLSLSDALERRAVADAALVQAEEAYRLAKVRFTSGITATPGGSPLLEISDAQTALTQAQINQLNAQYDIRLAEVRLRRSVGRDAYSTTPNPGVSAPPTGALK